MKYCNEAYLFGDIGEIPDKTKCGDTIYSGREDSSDGVFLCPRCTATLAVKCQELEDALRWRKSDIDGNPPEPIPGEDCQQYVVINSIGIAKIDTWYGEDLGWAHSQDVKFFLPIPPMKEE